MTLPVATLQGHRPWWRRVLDRFRRRTLEPVPVPPEPRIALTHVLRGRHVDESRIEWPTNLKITRAGRRVGHGTSTRRNTPEVGVG